MDIENKILNFIETSEWHFAKSMPFIPHWYCLLKDCDGIIFFEFVKYIRQYGVERPFGKRKFVYLDIGSYTYWTMDEYIPDTTIINRARIKNDKNYN